MKNQYRIIETKMFTTIKEVHEYVNDNKDQDGFRYETRTITEESFKVEKQKLINND